ncbi:hypothetical protein PPL_01663 [Heterostelium album PN500]|uniref:Ankyrin repeat-containing protein n=1 Tax=Heterostelium pallidum (strain ATCC 26659 / Pp 5 / PN500) TaxID=670386 RepID=D3B049_HETP5|nr:hypothetical protein PPL_01663 [Heterostelium album PN500]EFA84673.1 hypothetical protein PPL_01663 [Heterostelium album PN500]|eukprot:XP_020436786.1 hypothetical protein PPL_01663 [Heterostelium album PN500]
MQNQIFNSLFKNYIIRSLIFKKVKNIHKNLKLAVYSWSVLVGKPKQLIAYDYVDALQYYWLDCKSDDHYHYRCYLFDRDIHCILQTAIKHDRLKAIQLMFEKSESARVQLLSLSCIKFAVELARFDIVAYMKSVINKSYYFKIIDYLHNVTLEKLDFYAAKQSENQKIVTIEDALQQRDFDTLQTNIKKGDFEKMGLFIKAVKLGVYDVADWLVERYCLQPPRIGLRLNANQETYLWLSSSKQKYQVAAADVDLACGGSSLDLVKFLYEKCRSFTYIALYNAFSNYRLDILKWLHEKGAIGGKPVQILSRQIPSDLPASRPLETVQWFHKNRTEGFSKEAFDTAARFSLDIVKFLHYNRTEGCTANAMSYAAINGQLETFQFLAANRTEGFYENTFDITCGRKHCLEMVKYLHANYPTATHCTKFAMNNAIRNRDLETVRFLNENRTEGCSDEALGYALENNDLEMVKYLDQHQLVKHELYDNKISTCLSKLDISNLDAIDWLLKNPRTDRSRLKVLAKTTKNEFVINFLKDYNFD